MDEVGAVSPLAHSGLALGLAKVPMSCQCVSGQGSTWGPHRAGPGVRCGPNSNFLGE